MTNINNWKVSMKRIADEKNLNIQEVQQRYILEEFAEKISCSNYRSTLILKGGFVVSALLGLDTRVTRDLDVTCNSTLYSIKEVEKILESIIHTSTKSLFHYSLSSLKEAQMDDRYTGYIAVIHAAYEKTNFKLKIDISNNTLIYPKAIHFSFDSIFLDTCITIMTCPIELIIAEKFETTLDRGEYNTRMRDLFDVYLLMKEHQEMINETLLAKTIIIVSKDRGTLENLEEFVSIIENLLDSSVFNENFNRYKHHQYSELDITLNDVFEQFKVIKDIVDTI